MSRLEKSWPSASHPALGYHMQGSGDEPPWHGLTACISSSLRDSAQETFKTKRKKKRHGIPPNTMGKNEKKTLDQKVKCNPPSQAFPIYALQPLALILGAGHLMHEGAIKAIRQTSPRRRLEYRIQRPSPRLAVASHLARSPTRWLRRSTYQ